MPTTVGIPVVPITTGRACHLDAAMVSGGLKLLQQRLDPSALDLLLVENVGNHLRWGTPQSGVAQRDRGR